MGKRALLGSELLGGLEGALSLLTFNLGVGDVGAALGLVGVGGDVALRAGVVLCAVSRSNDGKMCG